MALATDPSSGPAPAHAGAGRRAFKGLAQLAVTGLVTWLILERLGPGLSELARTAPRQLEPRWGWITASCGMLAAGYAFSGWIWGRMVADLGGPTLPARDAIRTYMVANLGRYVPGKLWQIAGLALLARARGVPAPIATAAAVVGQAVALAGAMLVGLLALGSADPNLSRWAPVAIAATIGVLTVVIVPKIFRPLLRLWLRWAPGETPGEVPVGALKGFRWLALYTLNWGGYALAFWMLVRGLSLPGGLLEVGPAFAAAYVFGYVVLVAPAGLGVREASMVALLAPIMGPSGAALAAVAARVWTTVVEVVPAGAFWLAGFDRARDGGAR